MAKTNGFSWKVNGKEISDAQMNKRDLAQRKGDTTPFISRSNTEKKASSVLSGTSTVDPMEFSTLEEVSEKLSGKTRPRGMRLRKWLNNVLGEQNTIISKDRTAEVVFFDSKPERSEATIGGGFLTSPMFVGNQTAKKAWVERLRKAGKLDFTLPKIHLRRQEPEHSSETSYDTEYKIGYQSHADRLLQDAAIDRSFIPEVRDLLAKKYSLARISKKLVISEDMVKRVIAEMRRKNRAEGGL